jgi:hypothetical protein
MRGRGGHRTKFELRISQVADALGGPRGADALPQSRRRRFAPLIHGSDICLGINIISDKEVAIKLESVKVP